MSHHLVVTRTRAGETSSTDLGTFPADGRVADLSITFDALLAELATPAHLEQPPSEWTFVLTGADDGEDADEHTIYNWAGHQTPLQRRLVSLLRATEHGAAGHRPWADEETPTGSVAAYELAFRSRRNIPVFIRYLRSCDLDHEVNEYQQIDDIVELYDWADDTFALVAARLGSCAGQSGSEQIEDLLENAGLAEALESKRARRRLGAAIIAEFDRDDDQFGRQLALPQGAFDAQLDLYLENVEELLGEFLTPKDLATVATRARARRAAFRG